VPIPCFFDEVNHSPDGFNWGYNGSGPSQLSYAILRHFTNDSNLTRKYYIKFRREIISKIPMDREFELPVNTINEWMVNL